MILFFFFFQAEDGIRDIGVTGVQTCALPILGAKLLKLHSFSPELKLVNIKVKKKKIKKNILNQHVGLSSAFSKE